MVRKDKKPITKKTKKKDLLKEVKKHEQESVQVESDEGVDIEATVEKLAEESGKTKTKGKKGKSTKVKEVKTLRKEKKADAEDEEKKNKKKSKKDSKSDKEKSGSKKRKATEPESESDDSDEMESGSEGESVEDPVESLINIAGDGEESSSDNEMAEGDSDEEMPVAREEGEGSSSGESEDEEVVTFGGKGEFIKLDEQPKPAKSEETTTVVIKNFPFEAQEEEIMALIEDYKGIVDVRIPKFQDTGKLRGLAFVECESEETANKILNDVNGVNIGGRNIVTKIEVPAHEMGNQGGFGGAQGAPQSGKITVVVKNFPYEADESEIRGLLDGYEGIMDVRFPKFPDSGKLKGLAFLDVEGSDNANKIVDGVMGADVMGRQIIAKIEDAQGGRGSFGGRDGRQGGRGGFDRGSDRRGGDGGSGSGTTLFIGGLSYDASPDDVGRVFSAFGDVKRVNIGTDRETGRPRGFAHVEFENEDGAKAAMQQSENMTIMGRRVRLDFESSGGRGGGGRGGGGFGGDRRGGRGGFGGGDRRGGYGGFGGGDRRGGYGGGDRRGGYGGGDRRGGYGGGDRRGGFGGDRRGGRGGFGGRGGRGGYGGENSFGAERKGSIQEFQGSRIQFD